MNESELHNRLTAAVGDRTYRRIGDLTNTHPETVRRYMQGQAPSAEFLVGICQALGINGNWLLTGQGPRRVEEIRAEALGQADAGELLTAISNTLTTLIERVERLEVFSQTVDARVRALGTLGKPDAEVPESKPFGRATRIAGGIGEAGAERTPPDAD
ncbi:MAG: hypothetical protein R3B49_11415 [Phycisphaerales bacterium]